MYKGNHKYKEIQFDIRKRKGSRRKNTFVGHAKKWKEFENFQNRFNLFNLQKKVKEMAGLKRQNHTTPLLIRHENTITSKKNGVVSILKNIKFTVREISSHITKEKIFYTNNDGKSFGSDHISTLSY